VFCQRGRSTGQHGSLWQPDRDGLPSEPLIRGVALSLIDERRAGAGSSPAGGYPFLILRSRTQAPPEQNSRHVSLDAQVSAKTGLYLRYSSRGGLALNHFSGETAPEGFTPGQSHLRVRTPPDG